MIDQRLRELFDKRKEFGGKSIVVGHLRQLKPIGGEYVFHAPNTCPNSIFISRNPIWELFSDYELDEILRQQGDWGFTKALNNMAEGCMDANDVKLIKSRLKLNVDLEPPSSAIWLFYSNIECKAHNSTIHERLNTNFVVSLALDKVTGN